MNNLMEAVVLHGSLDQSISPFKSHLRNPKKIQHPFISRPSEKFLAPHFNKSDGLLQAPPPFLSQSYPPYSLPQPPILPLPAAGPRRSAHHAANRIASNGNRARDSSHSPRKSKSPKKEEKNSPNSPKKSIVSSSAPLGPDPKELPKDVAKVLPFISSSSGIIRSNSNNYINRRNSFSSVKAGEDEDVDMFSGSALLTVSPPPSSLPLPTFSLRPKLTCKADAASGIDTGATDDLRRLLRLL